jgi:cholesterol transport system auxiliary component
MRAVSICVSLFLLEACALTSKAVPVDVRYFSPEHVEARGAVREGSAPLERLRLGRITSSANLRRRIVRRESAVELGAYETLRWTENPEEYVQRSLMRALFDERRFEQAVAGRALTLDVNLISFEEARRADRPIGRVRVQYRLHDEQLVLKSGVVTVERPAASAENEAVVVAIGSAMDAASVQLVSEILASSSRRTAPRED